MEIQLYQSEAVRRFCAQWHNFFDFNAPTCLRLRPIISPRHPLRNHKLLTRNVARIQEIVRHEIECVDTRTNAISDQILFSEALAQGPEYAAFIVATKLLQQGHHEQYLTSLENKFKSFGDAEAEPALSKNRLLDCFSEDKKRLNIRGMDRAIEFSIYFCIETKETVRAPGFQILRFDQLPSLVAESFLADVSLSEPSECKYLSRKSVTIDENLAVEEALETLSGSGKANVLGKQRASIEIKNLYRKVVVSSSETTARFNWSDHRLYFLGLRTEANRLRKYRQGIESESFQIIVKCYSEATQAARNKDIVSAFSALVSGIDWLFKPVAVFRGEQYTSKCFVDHAARFMATEVFPDIFENCFVDSRRISEKEAMKSMTKSDGKDFYNAMSARFPESYLKYRVLNGAKLISRSAVSFASFQDSWLHYATRFFFDFTHIICFRNALVHESAFFAERFYVTELSKLYRRIIDFRLACADALQKLDDANKSAFTKFQNPDDACFAFCFNMMLLDTEFSRQTNVWLNSGSIQSVYKRGWANWGPHGLHELIGKNIHLVEYFTTQQYKPTPINFRATDRLRLL